MRPRARRPIERPKVTPQQVLVRQHILSEIVVLVAFPDSMIGIECSERRRANLYLHWDAWEYFGGICVNVLKMLSTN